MVAKEGNMAKYRKKPVVIDAVQKLEAGEVFDKLHGVAIPHEAGDWIITGVKGERYPCKPDVFEMTYERV